MLAEEFKSKRPLYEQLSIELARLVKQLATTEQIPHALVEQRTKTQDSLEEKIARPEKDGRYSRLSDVTDLCGVRIVLFTHQDCQKMIQAIRANFDVDDKNSVVKGFVDEDRFGYQSTHIVVSLPKSRVNLFDWSHLKNLKAEIQIRTVLQHAWAVLDWQLRYKTEVEVPVELRRRLYRISALLETADDAFGDLQRSAELLRESYANSIREGKLEIPLNRDSLEKFLTSSFVIDVLDRCRERGVLISKSFPRNTSVAFNMLIRTLEKCGITTLSQFESALRLVNEKHIDEFEKVSRKLREKNILSLSLITPLRILMLAQLPKSERIKILKSEILTPVRRIEIEVLESED